MHRIPGFSQPVTGEFPGSLRLDNAGAAQIRQVPGDGGLRELENVTDVADT